MRKVGIMSMQRIANYGSFLQAYALKQLIEELGCKVEFVDYHVGVPVITENADSNEKRLLVSPKTLKSRLFLSLVVTSMKSSSRDILKSSGGVTAKSCRPLLSSVFQFV